MTAAPVSQEIGGALGRFFFGGTGPSHTALTRVFSTSGYSGDDPYRPGPPASHNKEERVQTVVRAACRRPARARELVDTLLAELRLRGCFTPGTAEHDAGKVLTAQRAFRRSGWALNDDGLLSTLGAIDLATGGREALDEQLARLRQATEDPGQLLGSAKDLMEAVAKFVLEELGSPQDGDFGRLWYLARDRLEVHPNQVAGDSPGAGQVKKILGASWTIAEQVNELRNLQGAGHGRTLPTGVTPEMALLVVREACSVAQFALSTLDRRLGK